MNASSRFAIAAAGLSLFALGCESNKDDFWQRMIVQPKYKYYQQSEFWEDGRAMRTPPTGTVSREMRDQLPLRTWANPDGTYASTFPPQLKVDEKFVRAGQHKFNVICANCHGVDANGHSIPGENMALHPAPSLVALTNRPVGYFVEAATNGYGLMPNFAGELTLEERWEIAAYIRTLQLTQGVAFDSLPQDVQQKILAQPTLPPEQGHGEEQKEKM